MSVDKARAMLPLWEARYRARPNAMLAMNLACLYFTLKDGDRAMAAANMVNSAVAKANGSVSTAWKANVRFNRGMFLRGYGKFEESRKDVMAAWDLDKSSDYCAMTVAEEYLREGNWTEGWKLHNSVRGTVEGAALACGLPTECKFWDGQEHPEHLMVINEGGAGDRINYTRFLPLLTERNINWSFFCYDEMAPFYERLPWIGRERLILEKDKKEFCPPPSHWTTTFSLAGPLGITPTTIPGFPTPYTAPKHDFQLQKQDDLPMIGLAWNANELFQGGLKWRSLSEGQAMRLVCMTADKVHWVNLQHGHKMPYPVLNATFETWQDTAVLMDRCDAVVTVDSGPLWLSLAMEKPTAALLTCSEDWKFASNWGPHLTPYHNGPSEELFDAEKAIDNLIMDIRKGNWPHGSTTQGN